MAGDRRGALKTTDMVTDRCAFEYNYTYGSPTAHLTVFSLRTSPAVKAYSRGFFAGARPRLGRSGRRRRSARAPPHALARGFDVGIYEKYLSTLRTFPAISAC